MTNHKPCRQDVYQHGEIMFYEHMPSEEAKLQVEKLRKRYPNYWIDWHYFAGRAVFKKLRKQWWRRIFS